MFQLKFYFKSDPSTIRSGGIMPRLLADAWCEFLNTSYPTLHHYFDPV